MSARRTPCRAWMFLLFAGLFSQAPLAAGQQSPRTPQSHLTPDVRGRLAQAAGDSTLAPWQRDFMLEVARQGTEGTAARSSPTLPGVVLRSSGIAADDGAWIEVPPPSGRIFHTAIYDPVRDRMVVFGGSDSKYRNDVWVLSLAGSPAWSAIVPGGSPPTARYSHTAIYDPVRDQMVVFGGRYAGGLCNDVWALSLSGSPAWSAVAPTGIPPTARYGHTANYDPVRDRMLVFGGSDGSYRSDVWSLSLAGNPAWSELVPAGGPPPGRTEHTAIYDPVRDRMLVFGGWNPFRLNDAWALTLSGSPAWSALFPSGTPPAARHRHTAIYDPVRDRMVVFGGLGPGNEAINDGWALALSGSPVWSALVPAGGPPSGRTEHTAVYDPVRDRMVVFGGSDGNYRNDLWALTLSGSPTWSALAAAGTTPTARYNHTTIYDPVRDQMVVFSGVGGSNDVWALSLAGSPAWSALTPAGTPPSARYSHTAIYDPVRDRMVLFGGYDVTRLNEVWALTLSGSPAWNAIVPGGSPPSARFYHTAIYDPLRDQMVVFGGNDGSPRNDVWVLTLSGSPAWSALAPAGTPPSARYRHTAIYDPVRDRMVMFGGTDGSRLNDVWALTLSGSPAWSALAPAGAPPSARVGHTGIYDPMRDRMVVFGGTDGTHRNDAWSLMLSGSPAWSAIAPGGTPPIARFGHAAIYDPVRDRMVVFGGVDGSLVRNDVWTLGWTPPVSVPVDADALPHLFELAPPRPNPSRGEIFVEFGLGEPARIVLDVFDAHGRRVKRIADEWFTAGRHTSTWRGDDDRGREVGTGVYFVRLQGGGLQATRRTVRVR